MITGAAILLVGVLVGYALALFRRSLRALPPVRRRWPHNGRVVRHGRQPSIYALLEKRTLKRLELASQRRRRVLQAEREGVEPGQVGQLKYVAELVDAQRDAAQRLLFELRRTKPRGERVERLDDECERLEREGHAMVAAVGETG